MYYGEAHTAIDDKGRIMFPLLFRQIMDTLDDDTWYFTRGFDGALFLFSSKQWDVVLKQVNGGAMLDPRWLDFRRVLLGSVGKSRRDNQGRIVIPQHLREVADLKQEAVLIGVGDHRELWSKAGWQAFQQRQMENYKTMAAGLFDGRTAAGAQETGGLKHAED